MCKMKRVLMLLPLFLYAPWSQAQENKLVLPIQTLYAEEVSNEISLEGREVSLALDDHHPWNGKYCRKSGWNAFDHHPYR